MMNLTSILLLVGLLQVSASTLAQKIVLSKQEMALTDVFKEIKRQSGYNYLWAARTIKSSTKVRVDIHTHSVEQAVQQVLQNLPLQYRIEDRTILISEAPTKAKPRDEPRTVVPVVRSQVDTDLDLQQQSIKGRVLDTLGRPIAGAVIRVKDTRILTTTDASGNFSIRNGNAGTRIIVQSLGYIAQEIAVSPTVTTIVRLRISESTLDEMQVIAYGTTSKRTNAGNVVTVSGEDINKAPVMNPMAALEGRVPGMIVNQTNGTPGSAVRMQIRGRTQVDATFGADESPLFIIDGVPMASGNDKLNNLASAITSGNINHAGLSPFATINAGDIESIDVLKDADATAIYGSRGASGVVLITTKKGKPGQMTINMRALTGYSKARKPDLLSTKDYVMMRKEAFANDNIAMTNTNAYDLLLWDTTRTGLVDELIGGSSAYTTLEGSMSGGSEFARYNVGGSYYRESSVFPKFGDIGPTMRANGFMNISTASANRKFTADFRGTYAFMHNQAPASDLSASLYIPPHYKLYNEDGTIAWNEGGQNITAFTHPLAALLKGYSAKSNNLNTNALIGYQIIEDLNLRASIGYNQIRTDEISNNPLASQNPMAALRSASSQFGHTLFNSWIFEPQAHYKKVTNIGTFDALVGGTWQSQKNYRHNFTIRDYPSDDFLGTLIGVPNTGFTNPSSSDSEYKYTAVFGRLNYNLNNTYIINLSGRRDGSSRFGPNYRFSNFAAVGAAWIFTNESLFKDLEEIWSFGKLRGSYGTTGNDKIGDYKYRDLYSSNSNGPTYDGQLALSPESLFKPDLHWERNKKLEIALELGFLKDRILFTSAWYRNRSNDPLVQYPLPFSTGFTTVTANLADVVVQNQGLELTLNSKNIVKKNFEWRTSFNFTLPENKLIAFPGLENTSYASRYIIGRSLDLIYTANFLGVDPITGLYQVADLNESGRFEITNLAGDLSPDFDAEPAYYGGLQNDFRYRNLSLSIFMNFNKQWTQNWRTIGQTFPAGQIRNMPTYVLKRWQQENDITDIEKFTTLNASSSALQGSYAMSASDAKWENLFYARLRTVELAYRLPSAWLDKAGIKQLNIMFQGQNLFTFSPFRSNDPQTVFIGTLAPLRTYVFGLQMNL